MRCTLWHMVPMITKNSTCRALNICHSPWQIIHSWKLRAASTTPRFIWSQSKETLSQPYHRVNRKTKGTDLNICLTLGTAWPRSMMIERLRSSSISYKNSPSAWFYWLSGLGTWVNKPKSTQMNMKSHGLDYKMRLLIKLWTISWSIILQFPKIMRNLKIKTRTITMTMTLSKLSPSVTS